MIDPDEAPEGWKLEHVLRVTIPGGHRFTVKRDDGKPVADLDELYRMLRSVLGSAQRAERCRQRRRDIRRRQRGEDGQAAA